MPITEEHILECYEAYIKGHACPYPQGMNATSAEMTMTWLAHIFNDQRWNRAFNEMQCRVVLARIQADFGDRRASEVALSIQRDIELRHENYGVPQYAHRQAIARYLIL
ncbi:MAG: hypothetical protein KGZ88_09600 [Methylomicrobium sp.]|nr:hypothetical protein [Methylomicrobium sp.]